MLEAARDRPHLPRVDGLRILGFGLAGGDAAGHVAVDVQEPLDDPDPRPEVLAQRVEADLAGVRPHAEDVAEVQDLEGLGGGHGGVYVVPRCAPRTPDTGMSGAAG